MIEVVPDFQDGAAWDDYVTSHPEGRFSHLWAYRYVADVYGYQPRYLGFRDAGRLIGVLPAFEAKSVLLGRRLVSQPFSEYGGFLLDAALGPEQREAVLEATRAYVEKLGFAELETHGNYGFAGGSGVTSALLVKDNAQELATLPLAAGATQIWDKTISRHVRKAVRKSEREGVTSREASDEKAIREWFFPLYLRSMKRLGSPPHPLDFFTRSKTTFGAGMRIFWAFHNDTPIAGLLGYRCGGRVSIINIVSDERFWHMRPNDLVHWEFIKWAIEQGCAHFDFGSVRYDGQAQFKEKWGCVLSESGYFFVAANASSAHKSFDSSSGSMALAGSIWKKYVPAGIARALGPTMRKHLIR